MKNSKLITLILLPMMCGCFSREDSSNNKYDLSILVPTGAPSIAFLNQLNNDNFNTNTVPNNIVMEMKKATVDVAVVDLIGGLNAIEKLGAPYKLASIITFGNFYIYATGNDDNNIMENSDKIVGFGQNNTPDILFNHLYNISIDNYVAGVSDIVPIAASGKLTGEKVDYCIIAEPVLYNVLNNKNAFTYGRGSKYSSFQDVWKEKYGDSSSILGAAIYVKNETYSTHSDQIDNYLNEISDEIDSIINNPQKAVDYLENYGTKEAQAQKIGINSNVVKGVLMDNNSINLGYLSSKNDNFNSVVDSYLNVVNPSLINHNNNLYE